MIAAMRSACLGLLLTAIVAGLVVPTAGACGCGVALEASVTRERALVVEGTGTEEIVASFDLRSDGSGPAAVVLPVPGEPTVSAIAHGDPLAYLDVATAPKPQPGEEGVEAGGGGPGEGVDVLGRETIGGYDVTRLGAGNAQALDQWLRDNGYTLPAGAAPILADYVDEGWRYVAIQLADQSDGRLKPLRVSFPTERTVYPMRLTQLATDPVELTLYVVADGPRRVKDLTVAFDGGIDELDPPPPPELSGLLPAGDHLTKLTATGAPPTSFTADLAIEAPAASAPAEDEDDDGFPWLLVVLAGAAAVGSAVLVRVLRRRRLLR